MEDKKIIATYADEMDEPQLVEEFAAASDCARLDSFLSELYPDFSRSYLQKLIKNGLITIDGQKVKPSRPVVCGETLKIIVPPAEDITVEAEAIPLDIVYEDADMIIVNKARGMVVHPAFGNYHGTLVNALLYHCKDLSGINGMLRPGIVHRIDKETTGLIAVAKNDKAHQGLAAQWQARTVERYYLALLHGSMGEPGGTVDAPIGRHPKDRKKMTVLPDGGRPAVTHYKVLERFRDFTLIEAKLDTGRTHQIRVHMRYLGHPVVGDIIYGPHGKSAVNRGMFLHSARMKVLQPLSQKEISVEAPLPADFALFLAELRNKEQ